MDIKLDELYSGLKNVIKVQEIMLQGLVEIQKDQQENDKRIDTLKKAVTTLVDEIKILKHDN